MQLAGQKVSVIGLARSGVALVRVLHELGAGVLASDSRARDALASAVADLQGVPFELESGRHTSRVWEGRDMVVISPGVPWDLPVLEEARAHGVPVIGEIELAWRLSPAPIVAITGTNGKSTTTSLIHAMLQAAGIPAVLAGNIGIPMVGEVLHADPQGYVVVEVSSFQLESIVQFRPHVGLVLNVTSDHLDRHGTFAAYVAAKRRIFENQTADDWQVLNFDDEPSRTIIAPQAHTLFFSRRGPVGRGCWLADGTIHTPDGAWLTLPDPRPLVGTHNEENILAAACVARALDVPPAALARAIAAFHPLHHRMEVVADVQGVRWIDDSKGTNPGAVVAAIHSTGRPTVLIAGGKDKGMDFTPVAEALTPTVKALVLLGESAPAIEAAARRTGYTAIHRVPSLSAAVETAATLAREGDCVLLSPACASFDMFKSAEDRGEQYAALVRRLAQGVAP